MSITSRINEMSSHIDQAYDELQGLGADLTNVNKNIENISMVLDDIYDSMPQVSGEGTSLTLDDTRVGKIKSTLKGNTSQDGTPTPTTPIPVNVVSGDNEIVIEGKNLLGYPTAFEETTKGVKVTQSKGVYTLSGTSDSSGSIMVEKTLNNSHTIKSGDYLHLGNSVALNNLAIVIVFSDGTNDSAGFIVENRIYNLANKVGKTIVALRIYCNTANVAISMQLKPMILNDIDTSTEFIEYNGNTYNIDLPVENLLPISSLASTTSNGITFTNNNDGTYTLNGTATAEATFYIFGGNTEIKANSKLTFSCKELIEGTRIFWYDNWAIISGAEQRIGSGKPNYTTTNEITTISQLIVNISVVSGTTVNNLTIKPMLEKGTKANSFTPYGTTPIELCKIGNYQDYFGKSDGRNLFDNSQAQIGKAWNNSTNSARAIILTPVLPNTTYSISYGNKSGVDGIYYFGRENENDSTASMPNNEITTNPKIITTSATTNWLGIQVNKTSVALSDIEAINIQIEKSSSVTPWQPYGVGKWYLHKEIGKVVFTGGNDEIWDISETSTSGSNRFLNESIANLVTKPSANSVTINTLSNYFIAKSANQTYVNQEGIDISSNGNLHIYSDTTKNYTVAQFETWLSTHNLSVYYPLATPTNTEITYQPLIDQLNELEKAMSKDSQTNISQVNNDLPFIISASALKEWSV